MRLITTIVLSIFAYACFGQSGGGAGLTIATFSGVSTAENIIVDSTGLFVRFGEASARLSFSQEVELTVNGVSCTFAATIFILSMHPVTVLAVGELSDYVQVSVEDGRMTMELEGKYLTFSN